MLEADGAGQLGAERQAAPCAREGEARQQVPGPAPELHVVVGEAAALPGGCAGAPRRRSPPARDTPRPAWSPNVSRSSSRTSAAAPTSPRPPVVCCVRAVDVGLGAREPAQVHLVDRVDRHHHQREPTRRRPHELEHDHVHVHVARDRAAHGGAASVRDDLGVRRAAAPVAHVARRRDPAGSGHPASGRPGVRACARA